MKLLTSRRVAAAASATIVAAVSITLSAPTASAASASAFAANGNAETVYYDNGDWVVVCDMERDRHGAMGWIEIRQANGSFRAFSHIYAGSGKGHCAKVHQDVLREASLVKVVSCLVDGPHGRPFSCGHQYVKGTYEG